MKYELNFLYLLFEMNDILQRGNWMHFLALKAKVKLSLCTPRRHVCGVET